MKATGFLSVVAMMVAAVTSCSVDEEPDTSPGSSIFEGLDPTVVAEVLSNPRANEMIEQEDPASRGSMAQSIVRNFIVCRDLYGVYTVWIRTGEPQALHPLPTLAHPLEPGNSAWIKEYGGYQSALSSGDPEVVRGLLTANGSCGQTVPLHPGNPSGPTIADAVLGAS